MHVFCDTPVSFGWTVWKKDAFTYQTSFIVKGTFLLRNGEAVLALEEPDTLSGEVGYEGEDAQSPCYASDFVPFKHRADILLSGVAYAPEGRAVTVCDTTLCVGHISKTLVVIGPRRWSKMDPDAFLSIPLIYENAYGGPGHRPNPVGKGLVSDELPNVEYPGELVERRHQRPRPAGFGPLSESWVPRSLKFGTWGLRAPGVDRVSYPENLDWAFFNAAPEDQQVNGYLRGDEPLSLTNLHPIHAHYTSRLPGLRMRLFVNRRSNAGALEFDELQLNLDTLQIDMQAEKMNLVWRGLASTRSVKLLEIEHVLIAAEEMAVPIVPHEQYRVRLAQLLRGAGPEIKVPSAPPDPWREEIARMEEDAHEADEEFARIEAEWDAEHQRALMAFAEAGVSVAHSIPDFDHARFRAEVAVHDPAIAEEMEHFSAETEQAEREMEAMEAEMAEGTALSSADVAAARKLGVSLAGKDLSGLDLSGLDLAEMDLSGALLRRVRLCRARLTSANLSNATLSGADLGDANLDGASLVDSDFTKATLAGATFRRTALDHATLSQLDLSAIDFSGCTAVGTDFSRSNLTGALFRGARLSRADFTASIMCGADFSGADLEAAQLEEVQAEGIILVQARAQGLHAGDGSDFSSGRFTDLWAPGSIWDDSSVDGADFTRAVLSDARFDGGHLQGTVFDAARLESAAFDDAFLRDARMRCANLLRATFERSDLGGACLEGANLYEVSFADTRLDGVMLSGANLKGTVLEQAYEG
jgi:uncharacterized protein YjbI with pentapeptide repeats